MLVLLEELSGEAETAEGIRVGAKCMFRTLHCQTAEGQSIYALGT